MDQAMLYSIVIPLYNRPDEIRELLESLTKQTYENFEVIVVEDGSKISAEDIVRSFEGKLDIQYYFKENTGQGFSRNFGFERAKGDYFIAFDSDCIIPADYLRAVDHAIRTRHLDAYGGPDSAHPSFTPVQKAISYAMTSQMSTGGIRGGKKSMDKFNPRGFNMGISRKVFEETGGFQMTRMGEDIEFCMRMEQQGFKLGLIRDAFVYHKRRTTFGQFYKQIHSFGRTRINLNRFHKGVIKWVHVLPSLFVIFCLSMFISLWINQDFFLFQVGVLILYVSLVFSDALAKSKNVYVGFLSVWAVLVQIFAYGIGFLSELTGYSKANELPRK